MNEYIWTEDSLSLERRKSAWEKIAREEYDEEVRALYVYSLMSIGRNADFYVHDPYTYRKIWTLEQAEEAVDQGRFHMEEAAEYPGDTKIHVFLTAPPV